MNKNYNFLNNWTIFEKAWLAIFSIIGLGLSFAWKENFISTIAFLSGIICVVLVAKGSLWNYLFGLINCLTYAYVSHKAGLYGEVILNLAYYLPMQFIGFFVWRKAMQHNEVKRRKLGIKTITILLFVATILIFLFQKILIALGGNLTLLDSSSTVLSVIAVLLMTARFREQWIFWIIVNIISITMWGVAGDWLMLTMWSAYLVNSIYGLIKWSREHV